MTPPSASTSPSDGVDRDLAAAYTATGASWRDGPALVYRRLAEVLVAQSPIEVRGAHVVDIGAGTGVAADAAIGLGARSVVSVDAAIGMLAVDADHRPPAVVGDAARLPLRDGSFDLALAAFSFNHLRDPAAGLAEAARIVRPGGAIVASAYAADDEHPVKGIAEAVLREHGWQPPPWQDDVTRGRAPLLSTEDGAQAALEAAGLHGEVRCVRVPFPDLGAHGLAAWRLGMAQHAPFVAALAAGERDGVVTEVVERLGGCAALVRSIVVLIVPR